MRSTSKPRILGAATVLGILLAIPAAPAAAECMRQVNRWPEFDSVAPTARRVVVGTVLKTNRLEPVEIGAVFTVLVEEVLRGEAPRVLLVDGLRSGRELRGSPACRVNSWVNARPGDRIAIAFRGRPASEGQRV